ncbi:hypothetical protein [Hymenobacter guriensis]|uniref:Phosphatidate cytidylyltransferase n=1 Tax=Hymenobacter guriensis TaxID=2793065 RepID=A0ABS0L7T7_9BACT|nr:hypothetical protein [Hymenobacter guriensis]MBG8556190.1 hypothetical protein [Hymenobacter guriensis]
MNSFRSMLAMSLLVLLTFSLSSCDVIGDIFKAGAWTGIIGVVLVILLIWWILGKVRRR